MQSVFHNTLIICDKSLMGLHRIHTSGGLSQPKTGLNPWVRFINYKFINKRKELVYFINYQHSTESSAIRGLKNKDT